MITSYYNTTKETGEELAQSKAKATNQEDHIIDIFEHLSFVYGTEAIVNPSRIESRWINTMRGRSYCPPITSIRRAMTNLTKKGKLVKTDTMDVGKYGKPEHCWRLAKAEDKQLELL